MTLLEEITEYCQDILNGKKRACKKHKWACSRFLDDLERQGNVDFPWIFDEEKAQRFLTWMTFFKHTKGALAGHFINPHIIQKFIFGNIYGWMHRDTGLRRFRRFYWQVGRKNAKSQSLAIVGLYELACMEEDCSEVYIAATKKDQTRYVWGEADLIAGRCEWLQGKILTKYHKALGTSVIMHLKSDSYFARMSKDDKKKGDGSNPQCGLLDEYHAHETTEYYDVLSSGMKTRKQPILGIITTAGFELNNPCYTVEYEYVSKLLDPDIDVHNDRYFAIVCELDKDEEGNLLDDIKDESCWIKANPIVAETFEGLESIRDELRDALDKPEKMRDFLTKTMNVWVNMRAAGYMNMVKWKNCGITIKKTMPKIEGLPVFVGFDLSSVIDLTSLGFVVPLPNDYFAVFGHSFMPEETLIAKRKTDKVDYDFWIKQNWMTATPGSTVDYRFMVTYMKQWIAERGLIEKELCFDRALAQMLMTELDEQGSKVIEIPQGLLTLSVPTKDFRAKVYSGQIIHDNNPVINWAMSNAVVRKDDKENIQLDKSKAAQRIDPVAAIINAYVRAMVRPEPEKKAGIIEL
ncbi:terminase large subunit [Sporomusa sphaeroides DSM 2875]|uniref:terminase large subunit n=1 Tax=Sporomusa sphaeroides TaxID=47679 RepID=UPI002030FAC8|nr:terminase TerL endonuclease subunit [Sporomusa sphaeroides]MCM0760676.1 terminase large subunit [Sporomusa sphaeroides DSM 2875]